MYTAAAIPRGGLFLSERESSSTSPPRDAFNSVLKLLMEEICKTVAANTVRSVRCEDRGSQMFQNFRNHIKILDTSRVLQSKGHSKVLQRSGATVQNLVIQSIRRPHFFAPLVKETL